MGEHAGRGDAARTMALLWGTGKPATRGPRPALRLERIVRKAMTLADAGGLGAASIRRVAEALSIGTMSLYVYVPGKGELLELMVDRVVGEQPLPSGDRGWRAGLEQYARDTWTLYRRHPWLLEVATSRTVLGPHVMARFDAALGVARRAGLRGKDAVAVVSLVDGYTRGAARVAVEATQAPAGTGQTDDEWWTERAPVLDQHLGAAMAGGRLQNVAAVAAEGAFDQAEGGASHTLQRALDEFEFGLQRVLDGVEAFVNGPRPARARSRRTTHRRGTRPQRATRTSRSSK